MRFLLGFDQANEENLGDVVVGGAHVVMRVSLQGCVGVDVVSILVDEDGEVGGALEDEGRAEQADAVADRRQRHVEDHGPGEGAARWRRFVGLEFTFLRSFTHVILNGLKEVAWIEEEIGFFDDRPDQSVGGGHVDIFRFDLVIIFRFSSKERQKPTTVKRKMNETPNT